MKYATLWKQIVTRGLDGGTFFNDGGTARVSDAIAVSTTIVGPPINYGGDEKEIDWPKYSKLSVPFASFWCEWPAMVKADGIAIGHYVEASDIKGGGWSVAVETVIGPAGDGRPHLITHMRFSLAADGRLVLSENGGLIYDYAADRMFSAYATSAGREQEYALTNLSILIDLMQMLSCKNVSLAPRDIPEKTRLAAKRHGGTPHPAFRYHVLTVRPPGSKADHPGEELDIMPRHVCRGHFSEYGPEFGKGLLFGKHAGRFYIPPHMRGDKKNGVVEKDYRVVAPNLT